MKYTHKQFTRDFPNDNACLDYIFNRRYGATFACPQCGKKGFHRIKKRKCYSCAWCGYQLHPTSGTIFHKSSTKLTDWFFAIYLMSASKNGVSAKELQRHLGTTYKTAWRIAHQIRSLMKQDTSSLRGRVEVDEAYVGGRTRKYGGRSTGNKTIVLGMVERKGEIRAGVIEDVGRLTLRNVIKDRVITGSEIITDNYTSYHKIEKLGYKHKIINHSKDKFVKGDIHTNTIENFWSQMKRSMDGTFHSISPKHLQSYVDEFAFRYNHRFSDVCLFYALLAHICEPLGVEVYGSVPYWSQRVSS